MLESSFTAGFVEGRGGITPAPAGEGVDGAGPVGVGLRDDTPAAARAVNGAN